MSPLLAVSVKAATLTKSSLGGVLLLSSNGLRVSNFSPLTHVTSPADVESAFVCVAPLVTAQPVGVGPFFAKLSLLTKQFQSVVLPLVLFRTMLPSADSKPLGLPITAKTTRLPEMPRLRPRTVASRRPLIRPLRSLMP